MDPMDKLLSAIFGEEPEQPQQPQSELPEELDDIIIESEYDDLLEDIDDEELDDGGYELDDDFDEVGLYEDDEFDDGEDDEDDATDPRDYYELR